MKKIAVYGAGGLGREIKMLIDQINEHTPSYQFVGFFDDGKEKGSIVNGYPVLGGRDELNAWPDQLGVIYAMGYPEIKKRLLNYLNNDKIFFPTLISPNAYIGKDDVEIGEGTVIFAGCSVTVNIRIGKHVTVSVLTTIGHDTVIEDLVSFMPGVNVSGEILIREGVYVGTNASIIHGLQVGEYTIIGAGAAVNRSLPAFCTAVGVPAKPIKFHNVVNN